MVLLGKQKQKQKKTTKKTNKKKKQKKKQQLFLFEFYFLTSMMCRLADKKNNEVK